MNEQMKQKILALVGEHRIMTVATLRTRWLAAGDDRRLRK
jgi:hypothetical protein